MLRRAFFGAVGALVSCVVGHKEERVGTKRIMGVDSALGKDQSYITIESYPKKHPDHEVRTLATKTRSVDIGPIPLVCPCGWALKIWRLNDGTWVLGSEETCSCLVHYRERNPDRPKPGDPITKEQLEAWSRPWEEDLSRSDRARERVIESRIRHQRHVQAEALGKIMVKYLEAVEEGTFDVAGYQRAKNKGDM